MWHVHAPARHLACRILIDLLISAQMTTLLFLVETTVNAKRLLRVVLVGPARVSIADRGSSNL